MPKFLRNIFFFLILFTSSRGNTQPYLLSSFPAENELSSRQITCFFQDSKGFIWIGTEDGLNLYNANSIKIFKHNVKDKNSLINNYIQNICEDKQGNLWIGTAAGVDRFSPSINKFSHFTEDDKKKKFGFKSKVYTDRKGNIWIGCEGLFKLDPDKQQFTRIVNTYNFNDSKRPNLITGFYNDSHSRYWVSTYEGLFLYSDNDKKFTRFDTPPGDENGKKFGILFSKVYEDKHGDLWVGSWGYGLYKIVPSEKKLLPVQPKTVSLTYTSQQLNGNEIFWYPAGILTGVNEQIGKQVKIAYHNNDPHSIRDDNISVLFTDNQNQLWIGYEQSGIQILSPGNQLIKTYPVLSEAGDHKIASTAVILNSSSSIYIGGWHADALCKLNKDYKIEKWWKYVPPYQDRSSSNVGEIYLDKNKNTWLATFNGLICMNEKTGEFHQYKYDTSQKNNSRFIKILPDGDSALWLAGYNGGLSLFSLRTRKLLSMGDKNDSKNLFWKITFDNKRNIWCADNTGSLKKFDTQKRNFTTFHFDSLTESSIYFDLAYDSAYNMLWVASSNGLMKVYLDNLHAELLTEKEGLPTTHVNLLCFDRMHRLWIGTDKGLSLYSQQNNSFKNFYANNGLSTEKIDHSLSVGDDGMLYIGAENHIMVMNINGVHYEADQSPVYISSITESGRLLQPIAKQNGKVIELPYNHNALSFEFAITDYINPEDNKLFYKLEGWDKDFIQTKKGEVSYNKLPPGKYIFEVKGINHNGIRNDKGDAVTIIIRPPFWGTWWFIILVSSAVLALIILSVRYISQRNIKEKLLKLEKIQAIEKERNRISKDMHDDLGSGLTKIAIMSEVVKKQINQPEKAKQQLENISVSSRELVDNLQDIIWILNPKNDTLENLAAYIREYAFKFFEPIGTQIKFNYPDIFPELKLSEETRRNIFLVIKESFNNVARHAWCNNLEIGITASKDEIIFFIKDDGKGFDMGSTRQFGNGLTNMQNRMEQIGGKYKIISQPGKGSETFISVPV